MNDRRNEAGPYGRCRESLVEFHHIPPWGWGARGPAPTPDRFVMAEPSASRSPWCT